MIFIYTDLPSNEPPYTYALELAYEEDNAAQLAKHFPNSIFFFADLCVEGCNEKEWDFNEIAIPTLPPIEIEWDIDANLPMYTRDYLRMKK